METRLEIASRLLSSVICQDQKRSLGARMYEVHHCLMLADALIANAASLPSLEISATSSVLGEPVAKTTIDGPSRAPVDLKTRVEARRGTRTKKSDASPTLH